MISLLPNQRLEIVPGSSVRLRYNAEVQSWLAGDTRQRVVTAQSYEAAPSAAARVLVPTVMLGERYVDSLFVAEITGATAITLTIQLVTVPPVVIGEAWPGEQVSTLDVVSIPAGAALVAEPGISGWTVRIPANATTLPAAGAEGTILRVTGGVPTWSSVLAGLATTGISGDLTITKPGSTPRTLTVPDASIEVAGAAEVQSANFQARNHGLYTLTASATVTDPGTPVPGHEFTTLVRNGTLTTSRSTYAVAGTLVRSVYHSGSWADYAYGPLNAANTWLAAQTIDRGTGVLPAGLSAPGSSVALRTISGDGLNNTFQSYAFGGTRTSLEFWAVGGTRGVPAATPAGTIIFSLFASGHNGTNYARSGGIDAVADGLWSGTNHGQYWTFGGCNNGSTTATEWMRLQNGNLGIGVTPSYKLDVGAANLGTAINNTVLLTRLASNSGNGDGLHAEMLRIAAGTNWTTSTPRFGRKIDDVWYNYIAYGVNGDHGLAFFANSVERMRLDSSGNLGIGVTPTAGNGLLQLASGTTKANGIAFSTTDFLYRVASSQLRFDASVPVFELYTASNVVPTLRFSQNGITDRCSIGANGTVMEFRSNSGVLNLSMNDTTLGFFGNRISKPTITGSRGGNAALASLLTNLASYGLITDSTTA